MCFYRVYTTQCRNSNVNKYTDVESQYVIVNVWFLLLYAGTLSDVDYKFVDLQNTASDPEDLHSHWDSERKDSDYLDSDLVGSITSPSEEVQRNERRNLDKLIVSSSDDVSVK